MVDGRRDADLQWPGNGFALPELTGRVAVITGGASGIGKGIAQHFRDEGAQVVISDVDETALRATADELGVSCIAADVTDAAQVQALADGAVARHGTVDIVINNAGVGPMGRIADLTPSDWRWMIDVNLFGVVHGIHAFLPILRANPRGGYLVNTASMAGLTSVGAINMGPYVASKMGVVGVSEILAQEVAADGLRVGVSVLCPGPVHSQINSSLRNRPQDQDGALHDVDATAEGPLAALRWMDPVEVGELVADGIRTGRFYLPTHPELFANVGERLSAIARAFDVTAEWVTPQAPDAAELSTITHSDALR